MESRVAFEQKLKNLQAQNCVYIDEAGIEDTLAYAYGWSKKGTRCFAQKLGHATERISIVAAWCNSHVFAAMTFSGYCDSLLIETWFEKVLIPKLRRGQTVILDNASFHRKAKLKTMLEAVGCHLLPLPPYSPDLNKIEHLWHQVKAIVSHHANDAPSLQDKINHAFCSL